MYEQVYRGKQAKEKETFSHPQREEDLLKRLREPYHVEFSKQKEKRSFVNFIHADEKKRPQAEQHFRTLELRSESGNQQLGFDPKEKKYLFMAATKKSPTDEHPRKRMEYLQKNRAKTEEKKDGNKLYLSEGNPDGAALLETEPNKRLKKEHFIPYANEEKSLMLHYLMPYADTAEEKGKLALYQQRVMALKIYIANSRGEIQKREALEEEKAKLEERINRLNEILRQKDQAFRRMEARLLQALAETPKEPSTWRAQRVEFLEIPAEADEEDLDAEGWMDLPEDDGEEDAKDGSTDTPAEL